MKEQLAAGLSEGQIAEFVENDEVHAGEIFGEPPLPAGAGFAVQPIDEVGDGIEAAPGCTPVITTPLPPIFEQIPDRSSYGPA